jgi:hypothetical protein
MVPYYQDVPPGHRHELSGEKACGEVLEGRQFLQRAVSIVPQVTLKGLLGFAASGPIYDEHSLLGSRHVRGAVQPHLRDGFRRLFSVRVESIAHHAVVDQIADP